MGFSAKQELVLDFPYLEEGYDAIICDGAIRSGKTIAELLSFILWSMNNFNEMNFIIAGKTVGAVQRNLIKPLQRIKYIKQNFHVRYASSIGYMEIRRGNRVNYYYVFGGINERSQDVVQGGTMGGAFLDEVALMPKSFVEQCIARCSEENALLYFSCNPEHPTHWFKQEWVDKAKEQNALYLHFTMDDNPSLSEKVKERYKRRYSGVFFQRYILGKWTKAEGIIYTKFADNNEAFILDEIPKHWTVDFIGVGVDFGGTLSSTEFVAKAVCNGYRDLVIIKNKKLTGEYDLDELGRTYQEFEMDLYKKYNLWFRTKADNAEPILIRSLKNYARYSTVLPAKKSEIFGRIKFTDSMMMMKHFWVLRECGDVINSLNSAVWDEKHENERLDDNTYDVDTLDAMEYSFEEDMKKFLSIVPQLKDVNT